MSKIGFVGLGIMGTPMAAHLIAGGHQLYLYDLRPPKAELTDKGGVTCASGKEVAQKSDIVIIMVPDTPDVGNALFAENGIAAGLSKGKIVIDMSSISPLATKEFAKKIGALGADYLDAPVSGGEVGAKAASLTIMVGGPQRAFDTMKPVFDKMGKNVTLVGANGDVRSLEDVEADMIRLAFGRYRGRMTEIAKKLGIGRSTLYRKMREIGLEARPS